ncbi:Two-component sensor PilS [hydrothermal vent metagenome]|uniref:Two-component sensor PilS n=1 Tax=hydrothermal vent metagenome TaxID=652676 RepID=A0A3B0ZWM9_9ZZZZ
MEYTPHKKPRTTAPPALNNQAQSWQPLLYLNTYRAVLSSFFLIIILIGTGPQILGEHNPSLFLVMSVLYLITSIVAFFSIHWRRPSFLIQVYLHVIIDIIAITLLMHASGGLQSGIAILLIIAIAGGSLLIARKSAILLAAIATLFLLLEQSYSMLYNPSLNTSFTQAGLIGAILFLTASTSQLLARRIRESEALATQRGVDLANMEQLTEYIIQRMQTGIVVVDQNNRLRLINESAWQLLGKPEAPHKQPLHKLSPELSQQLQSWLHSPHHQSQLFHSQIATTMIMPRFARLGTDRSAGLLIFLEDTSAMAQKAQDLKLASLGRLTASIAHEIRNPLGAISHAGQLLAESTQLDQNENRLIEIISNHSKRMNTIIENILQISRREQSKPEKLLLSTWVSSFIEEFRLTQKLPRLEILITNKAKKTTVFFDPSQLHQVVWNLCQNALQYTKTRPDGVKLEIEIGQINETFIPYLIIIDFGAGVNEKLKEQIFEPFFTTNAKGTGLGLYIARELCESNQAHLNYISEKNHGFRITFSDTRRIGVNE